MSALPSAIVRPALQRLFYKGLGVVTFRELDSGVLDRAVAGPGVDDLVELRCLCPENGVEALSECLLALAAQSVTVEDAWCNTPQERALFGEPGMVNQGHSASDDPALTAAGGWQVSRLSAIFPNAVAAREALDAVQPLCAQFQLAVHDWQLLPLTAQDWVRLTQAQFEPIYITPQFAIVPSWHDGPEHAHAQRMILDPGLAFGTGSHPTTRMCLQWLCAQAPDALRQQSVLDYGCGSGILAIAARMLGAQPVWAVDIDQIAVQATRDNARRNGLSIHTGATDEAAHLDAGFTACLPDKPQLAQRRFDIVLANILAKPLTVLAPLLCGRLAPKGQLIMSGILAGQAQEIAAAYATWLSVSVLGTVEDWVLMGGRLK